MIALFPIFVIGCVSAQGFDRSLFVGATEMTDLSPLALDVVDSDTLSTASILPSSSTSNAPTDISKQPLRSAVDAWNLASNAAKARAAQDAGWQPVSPNPWPTETASPSNAPLSRLNFALAPSIAQPSAEPSRGVPQWLPPGGTYHPEIDTWERTQGAGRQQSLLPSQLSFPYGLPQSTPSSAASDILPNAPTSPAAASTAPGASFADRLGPTTPVQTAGGTSAAAGATAQAPHTSAARSAGAMPSPIDPASLPPGSLSKADYENVAERNRYLASKYDPNSLYDWFINSFTGAMNDPANVRTTSEQAEHEALSQKIIDTVFRQPTAAEARLNMMAASPIGTTLSVFTGAVGGSQQAQDGFLIAGSMVDSFGFGRGLRTGGSPSVAATMRRPAGAPQAPVTTTPNTHVGTVVTEEGLATVTSHLAQFEDYGPNEAMLGRLAGQVGSRVQGADANFYTHELLEAEYMASGMSYDAAHVAALQQAGVSPFSLYHPEVIQQFSIYFNNDWRAFWGIR
jgi:hypothetical protein